LLLLQRKNCNYYTSSCSFISIFLCVSLITKLWFLAISSLSVFSSRNQEKKKTQEKQQGTKEKKEKPSQVSPFTFSHEHNRRRDEEKPQNKTGKKKQTTNKNEHSELHNCSAASPLSLSLSLSLSHLANTPKELLQHFLTYSIFVWSEVLPVSYSPMCSFLLTSSHSRSPSFLPFFLSSFLLFFPFFPPSVEPHLHSEDCNSNARRLASHLTGLSQAASIIPL